MTESIAALKERIVELELRVTQLLEKEVPIETVPTSLKLQPKGRAVLAVLIKNAPHFMTRERIMMRVWPDSLDISDRTVDATIARIRRVVEKHGVTIQTITSRGYAIDLTSVDKISALWHTM